jgi:hypothetical protein
MSFACCFGIPQAHGNIWLQSSIPHIYGPTVERGRFKKDCKDPGTWNEQLDAFPEGINGGDLAPLIDEVPGARKYNGQLHEFLGAHIRQLFSVSNFLHKNLDSSNISDIIGK